MRELERCPSCGSGDVGGASGIVHCYKCKDEVRAASTPEAAERWNIRAIFMRYGFIVPAENPKLYEAARALLERDREQHRNEGEAAMQAACRDLPPDYEVSINLEKDAGGVDLYFEGEKIELHNDIDDGLTGQIRIAVEAAIEHAKERG